MENPISIEATYLSTYFQYTCIDILKWRFWTKICPFFLLGLRIGLFKYNSILKNSVLDSQCCSNHRGLLFLSYISCHEVSQSSTSIQLVFVIVIPSIWQKHNCSCTMYFHSWSCWKFSPKCSNKHLHIVSISSGSCLSMHLVVYLSTGSTLISLFGIIQSANSLHSSNYPTLVIFGDFPF